MTEETVKTAIKSVLVLCIIVRVVSAAQHRKHRPVDAIYSMTWAIFMAVILFSMATTS